MPMLWAANIMSYTIIRDLYGEQRWPQLANLMCCYSLLLTVIYLGIPSLYGIFLGSYAVGVGTMVILSVYRIQREYMPEVGLLLFKLAGVSYFSGFALWILENLFCMSLPTWWKLHSVWHLTAGFGTYCWLQFAIVLHAHRLKRKCWLEYAYYFPYVEVEDHDFGLFM